MLMRSLPEQILSRSFLEPLSLSLHNALSTSAASHTCVFIFVWWRRDWRGIRWPWNCFRRINSFLLPLQKP